MIKKPEILSDEELAKIVNDATRAKKIAPKTCPPLVAEKWVAQAQNDYCYKEMLGQIKLCVLQAIADEPEYPSGMPDELWQELNGHRDNTEKAMRSTVRLTKNGITERFLQALQSQLEEG